MSGKTGECISDVVRVVNLSFFFLLREFNICNFLTLFNLGFSLGNASLEAAVNWVVEHENDPDIDQMPSVSYLHSFDMNYLHLLLISCSLSLSLSMHKSKHFAEKKVG